MTKRGNKYEKIKKTLKETIKKYILLIIFLFGVPSLTFWMLNYTSGLEYSNYVVNSMAGFLAIVFFVTLDVFKDIKKTVLGFIAFTIVFTSAIFIAYYSFDYFSAIHLTPKNLAEAGFSIIFSLCIVIALQIGYYKEKEKKK